MLAVIRLKSNEMLAKYMIKSKIVHNYLFLDFATPWFTILHVLVQVVNDVVHTNCFISVPTPAISVTAPNTQTVGQSLTLQCEVTTVRGITSRVDIVWSSDGTELERMNNVSSTTMDNSLVYTDSYTISQLSTTDDGRVIQCEVVINTSPSVMASDNITLDVSGEYYDAAYE